VEIAFFSNSRTKKGSIEEKPLIGRNKGESHPNNGGGVKKSRSRSEPLTPMEQEYVRSHEKKTNQQKSFIQHTYKDSS
jgi:hypothetical protein